MAGGGLNNGISRSWQQSVGGQCAHGMGRHVPHGCVTAPTPRPSSDEGALCKPICHPSRVVAFAWQPPLPPKSLCIQLVSFSSLTSKGLGDDFADDWVARALVEEGILESKWSALRVVCDTTGGDPPLRKGEVKGCEPPKCRSRNEFLEVRFVGHERASTP
ncbi:hypothetical protein CEXT_498471 [Caerostris extrusa]|uniref:Uncharacterized protein n=1 Tax=Caerostris extrusa TaxID=172846 RepID=A0AAV4TK62_CAEEX|nr:hypothetical protein CEXT_498471 [Caerostris extrusa]